MSHRPYHLPILLAFPLTIAWLAASLSLNSPAQEAQPSDIVSGERPKAQSIDEALLFFPTKYPTGNWEPKGLTFENVFFASQDGTKLHGWYCPCAKPRGALLIAHGNAGHVAARAAWLSYLQNQAQLSVFMFDYRGYGRSEGTPTVEGAIQDATAARGQLRKLAQVEDSHMLLMGESLGGAIVAQLAVDSAPRGLILQSTFSSLRDVADVHFPKLSWLVSRKKLNSATLIGQYHGPLLQSHGSLDRTIPLSSGEKLFRAANEPKTWVIIEGAGHNNWLSDAYLKQLDQFIASVATLNRDDSR